MQGSDEFEDDRAPAREWAEVWTRKKSHANTFRIQNTSSD
jgi:hypothetical protein